MLRDTKNMSESIPAHLGLSLIGHRGDNQTFVDGDAEKSQHRGTYPRQEGSRKASRKKRGSHRHLKNGSKSGRRGYGRGKGPLEQKKQT